MDVWHSMLACAVAAQLCREKRPSTAYFSRLLSYLVMRQVVWHTQ